MIGVAQGLELLAEAELAVVEVDEVDIGAHEILVGGDDIEALEAGSASGGGEGCSPRRAS